MSGTLEANLPTVSFLKWAGGKRRQVPRLRELYEPHRDRRLVELFCGAANVALGLQPDTALLNDANPYLINCLRWVQDVDGFGKSRINWENSKSNYLRNRERFNLLLDLDEVCGEESAQLFYYLNKTAFNGLCRFNGSGQFNVSWGKYKTDLGQPPEDGVLTPWKQALKGFELSCNDFRAVALEPGDFVYADPPYDSLVDDAVIQGDLFTPAGWEKGGTGFTSYGPGGFSPQDQFDLAVLLAKHPGPVVIHNRATPRIVRIYEGLGFDVELVMAHRAIACNGDRSPAQEVIAKRNL